MITFRHTRTGVVTEVQTPEERAAQVEPPEFRDRTRRRQIQLIAKMDASSKWERVSTHQDASAPATPDPAPGLQSVATTGPAATPADSGPKFTRVVTTTAKPK